MNSENNIIIAEFMGYDILSNGYFNFEGEITTSLPDFNSNWNELIPVIKKCRERQFYGSQRLIDNIDKRLMKLDLLATYGNVIDFITHYNAQNS